MKKLLYIFTLALLVVACDKYDDQFADTVSIAEEAKEIDAVVDFDTDAFKAILERLSSTKFNKKDITAGKGNPVGSYLRIIDGIIDGVIYEFAYSDDNDTDLCNIATAGLNEIYFILANDQGHVAVSSTSNVADAFFTIEDDYAYVFEYSILQGAKLDNGSISIASANTEGTTFTFN